MSNRTDIPNRLIYTCNYGWLDLGHVQSNQLPHNRYASPAYLWRDILEERGVVVGKHIDRHLVLYRQKMSKFGFGDRFQKVYSIQKGLPLDRKRAVALAIYMEVSLGFENLQMGLLTSLFTDSGFSEEDLVSNLIGFNKILYGGLDLRTLCRPVSTQASLKVWDTFGAVGKHKNTSFSPKFHACDECKTVHGILIPKFPSIFNSIRPAQKGEEFNEPTEDRLPVPLHMVETLF